MQRLTRFALVAIIALGSVFAGLAANPADAASPLGCPTVCLTGGLLALGGRSVAVTGVHAADTEHRDYSYQWLAIDLTEFPPISVTLTITFSVDGSTSNGVFTGTGDAAIFSAMGGYNHVNAVTLTDSGLTVDATGGTGGESLNFAGTVIGGGVASFQSTQDYDWTGCGEC